MPKNKVIKLTIIVLSVIIALWLLVLVALQILLKTSVLDRILANVATELVDGDVSYSKVKINVVKSFPHLNVTIDSLSLTYPHDRWIRWDSTALKSPLLSAGRGEVSDTLASFETLSASVNYMAALSGSIRSRGVKLSGARFYAHQYGSGQANWKMFRTGAPDTAEQKDESEFSLPPISVDRIVLNHHPRIVYTAQEDTVFLFMELNRLVLHGDLEKYISDRESLGRKMDSLFLSNATNRTGQQPKRKSSRAEDLNSLDMASSIIRDSVSHRMDIKNSSIALHLDSLYIGGRLPDDTLGLFVNMFDVQDRGRRIAFEMDARAMFLTRMFGRLHVPVHFSGEVGMDRSRRYAESMVYQLRHFNGSVAYIPILMNAMLRCSKDSIYVGAALKVDNCNVGDVLESYGENFIPALAGFHTDAHLTLSVDCNGYLDIPHGIYPKASLKLSLPEATVSHDSLPKDCRTALSADASLTEKGKLDAHLERLMLDVNGLFVDLSGQADDLSGGNPLYSIHGCAETSLDDLAALLPDSVGPLNADGALHLDVSVSARQSQLCKKGIMQTKIDALLSCSHIDVDYPKTGLVVDVDSMTLRINDMKSLVDSTQKAFGARLSLNSLFFGVGDNISLQGKAINLLGNLAPKRVDDSVSIPQFKGKFGFDRLSLTGMDSVNVHIRQMDNIFTIDRFYSPILSTYLPRVSLSSKASRAALRSDGGRFSVRGVKVNLSTVKRKYSASDVDTLLKTGSAFPIDTSRLRIKLPDFMTEKDFEKSDIDFKVNESVSNFFASWFPKGELSIDGGRVITPLIPLRNRIDTVNVHFNGNLLSIDRMGVRVGKSDLSAKGSLKRINPPGKKTMASLDMDITSSHVDIDELLLAWNQGKQLRKTEIPSFTPEQSADEDYIQSCMDSVVQQLSDTTPKMQLIVVPANLLADIRMNFDSVRYSKLIIDTLKGSIVSKGRCLQLTGWKALSNMGTMNLDAFYSTITKKDISAGFNLGMHNITAQEVIGLIPVVDSVMPLLKTFKGELDCEMTATTKLDTCMNLLLPTLNGVFKISGKNLGLEESAALRKIARLLLFRNKRTGDIDDMSAYGIISNNMLEVFPFILDIDRYKLAVEGRQRLDKNFDYYLSVITSPLPFQFGIDLYGESFDKWKYRLGATKYTHSYYIPLFDNEVDSMQLNLISSIRAIFDRGVERVLVDNARFASSVDSLRAGSRGIPPVDEKNTKEVLELYQEEEKNSNLEKND